MKAKYIKPITGVVTIATMHIMAGSLQVNMNDASEYDSNTQTLGSRRGGSFWDDEE